MSANSFHHKTSVEAINAYIYALPPPKSSAEPAALENELSSSLNGTIAMFTKMWQGVGRERDQPQNKNPLPFSYKMFRFRLDPNPGRLVPPPQSTCLHEQPGRLTQQSTNKLGLQPNFPFCRRFSEGRN